VTGAGRLGGALAVLTGLLVLLSGPAAAADRASLVVRWHDPAIDESSGLLDLGDRVATVNDSGDGPLIYVVDSTTGETTGRTTYSADAVVDVEALARGPGGTVWVGDIGDNDRARDEVSVYRLPGLGGAGERTVAGRRFDLVHPDGPNDAEALLVHPRTGRLYVVTKGLLGGEVMAAPATLRADRPNVLRPVARVGGLVTDGAFLPDGRHAVLRSYGVATLYDVPGWHAVASLRLPAQPQGEGLAVSGSGRRLLLSSEGAHTAVLSMPLSPRMLAALDPATRSAAPSRESSEGQSPEPAGRSRVALVAGLAALVLSAGLGAVVLGRRAVRGARPRSRSTR